MDTTTLAGISRPPRLTPAQQRAEELNDAIKTLESVRNELSPEYISLPLPEEKPKGRIARMCSRIAFWLDMAAVYYWIGLILFFAGVFVWGIITSILDRLL